MTWRSVAAIAATLFAAGCGSSSPGKTLSLPPTRSLAASSSSHVVTIVMENKEYGDVIGSGQAPYTNGLGRRYGLAVNSFGVRHPSLPNYLSLTGGSTFGIITDCTDCSVAGAGIVDQLEAARVSWKAYMEDMPRPCFRGASSGGYAKKHDPFMYYESVAGRPARCRRVVPFTALGGDLRRGRLPTYAWISPNLCDDTHDCSVRTGDRFLAHIVPALLRELGPHGFLVLTWDEGSSDSGCCGVEGGHIPTIVAGPDVRRGARLSTPVDHYGVLRTVEDALGLPRLRNAADSANGDLDGLFTHPPHLP